MSLVTRRTASDAGFGYGPSPSMIRNIANAVKQGYTHYKRFRRMQEGQVTRPFVRGSRYKGAGKGRVVHFRRPKTIKAVKSIVGKLQQKSKEGEITHVYRDNVYFTQFKPKNENEMEASQGLKLGTLQNAINTMQYYDAATGDFVTRGLPTGTDSKQIIIDSAHQVMSIKNNYQIPVFAEIWVCIPKKDTSALPNNDYDSGIVDVVTNAVTMLPNHELIYPTDSPHLLNRWTIKCLKKKLLKPGDYLSASKTVKHIVYNPQNVGTEVYQKQLKGYAWITLLRGHPGTIGHNITGTAGTQFGQIQGQVDGELNTTITIKYDGGINAKRLHVAANAATLALDGGCVSQLVVDNQTYATN